MFYLFFNLFFVQWQLSEFVLDLIWVLALGLIIICLVLC